MGIYKDKWSKYRHQNKLVGLNLIVGLPVIVGLCLIARWLFKLDLSIIFPLLAAAWAICWGITAFKLVRFPCPRCGQAFLSNQQPKLQSTRYCSNCGLKLYEDAEQ